MRPFLPLLTLTLLLAACQADDTTATAPPSEAGSIDATVDPGEAILSAPAPPFNVNTATAEQLATIPGVGDRMIHEFEEYRPYSSVQQFRREIGKYVDDEVVAGYEEYLFVPVHPNEADAETLMQLPGMDATAAQTLIDGRPYASEQAFLTAYESAVGEPDAASASVYVEFE